MNKYDDNVNDSIVRLTCPYLGLFDDVKTHSSYPSNINVCYHCRPKTSPSLMHQQKYCLSKNYTDCKLFIGNPDQKMPRQIRLPRKRIVLSRFLVYIGVFILVAALLITSIFSGLWEKFFTTSTPDLPTQITNAAEGFIFITQPNRPTNTDLPKSTATMTPTMLPSSTITATPSITPTLTCSDPIPLYAMSYLGSTYLLSYRLPVDLIPFLVMDQNNHLTLDLDIPGLILRENGMEKNDYQTFLRDFQSPNLLFIEILTNPGNIIEFEFATTTNRFCSVPVMIARPDQIGTPIPTNPPEPTRDVSPGIIDVPTSIPTKKPSSTPTFGPAP